MAFKRRKPAASLKERLRFETLLSELSSAFAKLAPVQAEEEISSWLRRLVEFLGVDRGTFLIFGKDGTSLYRKHSYSAPGIEPFTLNSIKPLLPWFTEQLRRGNTLNFARLPEDLPEEAAEEREYVSRIGVKSSLNIPVSIGGPVLCVLVFVSLRSRRDWPEDLVQRLRVVGEVFGTAIARKRSEQALRRSEKRFRSLVEASEPIVWVTDAQGRPKGAKRWNELTGQSLEQSSGRGWLDAIHPDDRPKAERKWHDALKSRSVYFDEFRLLVQDGSYRLFAVRGVPVLDETGCIREWVGTSTDITEHRSLQEQLVQMQKMEAIGRLAGGVAHDFNNLLTLFAGYTDILKESLPPGDQSIEVVLELALAAERGHSLTRQLMAFSSKQLLAPRVLDLNTSVRDTEKLLRRLVGENLELDSALDPALRLVKADPGQVEQFLVNLAVNARDAMPLGGRVTIETRNVELDQRFVQIHPDAHPGPYVLLVFSDTGEGMSDQVKRRIFEPFFTTKETGRGPGLGLAIVYGIVKQSGGVIDVDSVPGKGTSFRIYLPAVAAEAPSSSARAASAVQAQETVLLVEDEEGVRRLARRILEQRGFKVLEAANGREALDLAAGFPDSIHLLLTDVVMPVMGGGELARRLAGPRPGTKVLFMSGFVDDSVVLDGVAALEASLLPKPFTATGLLGKVRDVLGQP